MENICGRLFLSNWQWGCHLHDLTLGRINKFIHKVGFFSIQKWSRVRINSVRVEGCTKYLSFPSHSLLGLQIVIHKATEDLRWRMIKWSSMPSHKSGLIGKFRVDYAYHVSWAENGKEDQLSRMDSSLGWPLSSNIFEQELVSQIEHVQGLVT